MMRYTGIGIGVFHFIASFALAWSRQNLCDPTLAVRVDGHAIGDDHIAVMVKRVCTLRRLFRHARNVLDARSTSHVSIVDGCSE
jgi:hypothetical protein